MMLEQIKKVSQIFLGIPLTLLSLFFVARYIFTNANNILPSIRNFDMLGIFIGIIFLTLFFCVRSIAWREILKVKKFDLPLLESTYLLGISELKRYIPGSIFAIAGRINSFGTFDIKPKDMLKMIGVESIMFAISTFFLSLPAIYYLFSVKRVNVLFFYAIIAALGVSAFLLRKYLPYTRVLMLTLLSWVFYGIGTFLVISSFSYINPANIVGVTSLILLSWLVGFLVIIAPLGLGIREGFMTYALSFMMPVGSSATLSIIARIALTVSELFFLLIVFIVKKKIKKFPKFDTHLLILCLSIFSYVIYFTYVSFQKYVNFFTGRFDLGNMDQTVWNTIHGNIFQLTNPDGVNIVSRLAFHADFILVFLAPFYLIWEDPRMLLFIQTVVIGVGAFFVYQISRHVLHEKNISLIFAVSYLLNPFIQKQNLFDFHAVTLATTFLLAAFLFLFKKKYLAMTLMLVLAALTKEHVFAIIGLVFMHVFIKIKNLIYLCFSVFSIFIFYLLIARFIPDARGGEHFAAEYFQQFGNTPFEIIKNFVLDPIRSAGFIFTGANFEYVYKLLLSTGFVSLFAPLFLIFSLPDLLINLLSENENLKSTTFHYAATIIPFVYISGIFGIKKILSFKIKHKLTQKLGIVIILLSLFSTYKYGTLPGSAQPSIEVFNNKLTYSAELENFLNKIPSNLSVAATNNLGSHISQREKIYTIPIGMDQADVVLFLLNDNYASPSLEEQVAYAKQFKINSDYILIYEVGDFVAFSKVESAKYITNGAKSL